jgi:hypothetical protein
MSPEPSLTPSSVVSKIGKIPLIPDGIPPVKVSKPDSFE